MATPIHESAWVVRAQCGDREALELLLRSAPPPLHRYVSRLIGATDADDVVQEVLVTLARKLMWLAEPTLFRAWMFRIASRKAFDHLRHERRRAEHPLDEETRWDWWCRSRFLPTSCSASCSTVTG